MNYNDLEYLADALGLEKRRVSAGNLVSTCPFAQWTHAKGTDRKPSFGITIEEDGESVYHCLHGSTRIITYDGVRSIGELVGTTQILLDGDGYWTESPIICFGKQRLWKVTLTRNRVQKEILTTDEHRWLKSKYARTYSSEVEVLTKDLKPGDRIPSVFGARPVAKTTKVSPFGVAHGFVFGDGTKQHSAIAYFNKDKEEMVRYFNGMQAPDRGDGVLRIGGLPLFFKDVPSLDETPSYILGWLAGYFAADGCVAEDGHASINSSNRENLEHFQMLCIRLGIATYGIRTQQRKGYGKAESDSHSLTLINSSLSCGFFLRSKHKDRFLKSVLRTPRKERTGWIVKSVEATDLVDDVYCPDVPGTHAFVLEDNVKTLNCFGCHSAGDLLTLVLELADLQHRDLSDLEGYVLDNESLGESKAMAKAEKQEVRRETPRAKRHQERKDAIAAYPESEYDRYRGGVPRYALQRGLDIETCKAWGLGHDKEEGRLTFPIRRYSDSALVGVKGRTYKGARAKYFPLLSFNTSDFLYGEHMIRPRSEQEKIVIVEGELDAIKCWMAGFTALALMGSFPSVAQRRTLSKINRPMILIPDSDSVGRKWVKRLGDEFKYYVSVYDVDMPEDPDSEDDPPKLLDAGSMDPAALREILLKARIRL